MNNGDSMTASGWQTRPVRTACPAGIRTVCVVMPILVAGGILLDGWVFAFGTGSYWWVASLAKYLLLFSVAGMAGLWVLRSGRSLAAVASHAEADTPEPSETFDQMQGLIQEEITRRQRLEREKRYAEGLFQAACRETRHREQMFEALLNAVECAVLVLDHEGQAIMVNRALTRETGLSLEDFSCDPLAFLHDRQGETALKIQMALAKKREVRALPLLGAHPSGRTLNWIVDLRMISDGGTSQQGSLMILRKKVGQVQMEQTLRRMQKLESIGTLAGGIAHDFNNILVPIVGYTEMTMERVKDDSIMMENLEEVLRATTRARELVKQILAFSRQTEQQPRSLRLQPIIKESLKLLRASLPTTIAMVSDLDEGCGPVLADPTQMHQIIMNLCTNAYHAMMESGGTLSLRLREVTLALEDRDEKLSLDPGEYARLSVEDTGCGIDADNLARIFDPFFSTKPKDQGTGMGLAVVHGIVRNHSGCVTVYSEKGKGTCFHVYLPRIAGPEDDQVEAIDRVVARGSERILLVDDEAQIAELEQVMLEGLGYHVTALTDSREALALFQSRPHDFDLVLTDQTMPQLTGAAMAKQILAVRPDVPIILCTGFSEALTEESAKAMGIRELVLKPILRSELSQTLRRTLDSEETRGTEEDHG